MSFARSTDMVLSGLRTIIGSSLLVGTSSIAIRHKPEADLYALPEVNATNYPLIALEDVGDDANTETDIESAKAMSIGVTLACHFVARVEDAAGTPREFCRQAVEAIDGLIGSSTDLGTGIIQRARWQGGGRELSAAEDLKAQGLAEHTTVWQFSYLVDRP